MKPTRLLAAAFGLYFVSASTIPAAVDTSPVAGRVHRRGANRKPSFGPSLAARFTNPSSISYNDAWSGAIVNGTGFKTVTGTVVVPTPQAPVGSNATTQYAASAWVGIDGNTCQTALLQTGVDVIIWGGVRSYVAWYEWIPDQAYDFSADEMAIHAGDSVTFTVNVASDSAGSVQVINHSTGQTANHTFTGQTAELCQTSAEWIVEDYGVGDGLVAFANYGSFVFTSPAATTESGATVEPGNALLLGIVQNDDILSTCNVTNTRVTCTYV